MKEKMPGASSKRWPGMFLGKLSCSRGNQAMESLGTGAGLLLSFLPSYFTLHSKRPQEWVSGCFSSSFTALVFTGSKFTMQASPRLHG